MRYITSRKDAWHARARLAINDDLAIRIQFENVHHKGGVREQANFHKNPINSKRTFALIETRTHPEARHLLLPQHFHRVVIEQDFDEVDMRATRSTRISSAL